MMALTTAINKQIIKSLLMEMEAKLCNIRLKKLIKNK